jgi:predicted Zn-dependent peptidase
MSGACQNFDIAAELFAKLLSPIILSPKEIAVERDRIKAEIREGDDATSLSTFSGNAVHEGTKLSNLITGTIGSVNKISAPLLEEYRRQVETQENIFFYVTGNFSDDNLHKLCLEIEKYHLEKGIRNENIAPVCEKFGKREAKIHIKNASFTMLRFSFDIDMTKVSLAETDLLYDMLFSGYNSLFFIEMSEKRGLCYDISGYIEKYSNIGELSFSFEVRTDRLYDAVERVISLLSEFKSSTVDEESMMKASYVTNSALLYDNPADLNFTFGYDNHIMNAGYTGIEDRMNRYAAITPERIREIASELFRAENLTLAMKGNKKKIDSSRLEEIIKKL